MRPRHRIGGACPVTSSDGHKARMMSEKAAVLKESNEVSRSYCYYAKVFGQWDRIAKDEVPFYVKEGFTIKREEL